MALMTDDDPDLNPLTELHSPDNEYFPALSANDMPLNPARAYLLSLNSLRSRQTMASFLGIVAGMLGAGSADTCSWGSLRRHHVMGITELLRDTGRATATVNTYLRPSRGWRKKPGCSGSWMWRASSISGRCVTCAAAGCPAVGRCPRGDPRPVCRL